MITCTAISSGVGREAELLWPGIASWISSQFGQKRNLVFCKFDKFDFWETVSNPHNRVGVKCNRRAPSGSRYWDSCLLHELASPACLYSCWAPNYQQILTWFRPNRTTFCISVNFPFFPRAWMPWHMAIMDIGQIPLFRTSVVFQTAVMIVRSIKNSDMSATKLFFQHDW